MKNYTDLTVEEINSAKKKLNECIPMETVIELGRDFDIINVILDYALSDKTSEVQWYQWMKKYGMKKGYISEDVKYRMAMVKSKYHL